MTSSTWVPENTTVAQLWQRQVMERADREFLVYEDVDASEVSRFTYREFDARVNTCANALVARGVEAGSRVALYLHNCVEFVECTLALAKMGAIAVPVDATSAPCELGRIMGLCEAQMLITCVNNLAEVLSHLPESMTDIVAVGEGIPGDEAGVDVPLLADLRADASDSFESNPHVDPMDTLAILFTSGTTSAPKGVVITQANFVFSGVFVNWELGMNPEDRYMTSMVAARVNFQLSALAPVLTMGATLIMLSRYSATRFWREAREHRATLVQGMAMIVATLLRQPVDPEEDRKSVV